MNVPFSIPVSLEEKVLGSQEIYKWQQSKMAKRVVFKDLQIYMSG